MKKLTTIVILISSLAALTACNPPTKEEILEKNGTDTYLDYKTITLKDGRKIKCVEYDGAEQYGISCNWNNPVNQNNTK